jgi:HSP20 family protein
MASKRAVPLVRALEKLLAAPSSPLAGSTLRPVAVAGGLRGYNTGASLRRYEGAESDEDSVREYENRRGGRDYAVPSLFSGSRHPRAMTDSHLLSQNRFRSHRMAVVYTLS